MQRQRTQYHIAISDLIRIQMRLKTINRKA